MSILFFNSETNSVGKKLQRVIEPAVPGENIEVFKTIENLLQGLIRPNNNRNIVVLFAANRQELLEILSFQNFFDDTRIILILPDDARDTFSLGAKLYPRFISHADSDFEHVAAVLRKMRNHLHKSYSKEVN